MHTVDKHAVRNTQSCNDFREWYGRERCPGSPENPRRAQRLAEAIYARDYQDVIDPDEIEGLVREALSHCFARFDAARGRPDHAVEERFLTFFKQRLRRRFKDTRRDRERRGRPRATVRYLGWRLGLPRSTPRDEAVEGWEWILYQQAVARLSREAQRFVQLHVVGGLNLEQTARSMGVSRSYLRRFGGDNLARIIREEIRAWALGLPAEDADELIRRMFFLDVCDEEDVAGLLGVDVSYVVDVVRRLAAV
jgi:DNA-directed RNA polymerase specialized sigma24 family protein